MRELRPLGVELASSSELHGRKLILARDACWRPMHVAGKKLDGVTMHPLVDAPKQWRSYWMKMEGGSRSTMHRHSATKMVVVVAGSAEDRDGVVFRESDVVTYPVGSTHILSSPAGCSLLVVDSKGPALG